jgi:hypothetical protein
MQFSHQNRMLIYNIFFCFFCFYNSRFRTNENMSLDLRNLSVVCMYCI